MRTDHYDITSHLSVDAIVERARAAGAAGILTNFLAWGAPIRGRANADRIVMVRRSIVNNSWRPYLFATPHATATGTRLQIEIRPTLPTRIVTWSTVPLGFAICIVGFTSGSLLGIVGLVFPIWSLLLTRAGRMDGPQGPDDAQIGDGGRCGVFRGTD